MNEDRNGRLNQRLFRWQNGNLMKDPSEGHSWKPQMRAWLDHVGCVSGVQGVTFGDGDSDQSRKDDQRGKGFLWLTVDPTLITFPFLYTRRMNHPQQSAVDAKRRQRGWWR